MSKESKKVWMEKIWKDMKYKYSPEEMEASWLKMISYIDKYFHTPIVCTDEDDLVREVIVPKTKQWAFDILNRVKCNYIEKEFKFTYGVYYPRTATGVNSIASLRIEDKLYTLISHRYLNENTQIIIRIKKD